VGGTAAGHVDAGWQMSGGKMIKEKGKDERKIKTLIGGPIVEYSILRFQFKGTNQRPRSLKP
jgi:hypothetical protein